MGGDDTHILETLPHPHVLLAPVAGPDKEVSDFSYIAANGPARKILGAEPELIGARLTQVPPALLQGSDVDGLLAALVAVHRTGEPLQDDGRTWMVPIWAGRGDGLVTLGWDAHPQRLDQAALAAMLRLGELAADVWCALDSAGLITQVAPTLTRTLGWRSQDWIGRPLHDFVHPLDLDVLSARNRYEQGAAPVEIRLAVADGGWRWMSLLGQGIPRVGVGGFEWLRDIDELVTTRQQARRRRDILQATLDSLLDPHALLQAVYGHGGEIVDFVYMDANDAACRYMAMPRHELIGARLLDLLPGQQSSGMLALYAQAVTSGEPLILDDYAYPHEIVGSERRYDIRAIRVGDSLSFTWRDVTERYRQSQALGESEARYRLLAENASDVVFRADTSFRFEWISPSVRELLGWDDGELVGRQIVSLIHADDIESAHEKMALLATGESVECEARFLRSDGTYRWLGTTAKPVRADGQVIGCVGSYRDIEETRAAREALNFQATHDSLTMLANRAEFLDRVRRMLNSDRKASAGVALLFADLDDLKGINDTHGHHIGDQAIVAVAQRLQACVRSSDIVGRIGGDEFVIALSHVTDIEDAVSVANKIRRSTQDPLLAEGVVIPLSLSIGIAVAQPGESAEELLRAADRDLYRAKAINRTQRAAPTI